MKIKRYPYQSENDYWRARNYLREVFLLNDRLEHSWNVVRLDYWRWHYILTCNICESVGKGLILWQTANGKIAAVLNDIGNGEIRLHVHPQSRSAELENEMLEYAEEHFSVETRDGKHILCLPILWMTWNDRKSQCKGASPKGKAGDTIIAAI